MPVTVSKLQGNDIPEEMRGPEVEVVFRVTDHEGKVKYLLDDVEAAQSAVRASDEHQAAKG